MTKPQLYVDFNEMVEPDLVLLTKTNIKIDNNGKEIKLFSGLKILVYMDDLNDNGEIENLIAEGVVEENKSLGWSSHVKWCCRINNKGIYYESESKY